MKKKFHTLSIVLFGMIILSCTPQPIDGGSKPQACCGDDIYIPPPPPPPVGGNGG